MKIVYSFNKKGFEAEFWTREIAAASDGEHTFVPFNHDPYVDVWQCSRAQQLDNLYHDRDPGLLRLYRDFSALLSDEAADAIIVDNAAPYHPEYLRTLRVYKVLRIADGPIAAYDRDFAYVHAYDHILYHCRAYSRDLEMAEKLEYLGARRADFWPLALFDAMCDPTATEASLLKEERDVDVVFVGALHPNKMPLLAEVRRALGRRFRMHGVGSLKKAVYFGVRYRVPVLVRPLPAEQYVPLYQRARIGINVHNRGLYTTGNYRLFELAGNGVLQISDGGQYLADYFRVGEEVVGYDSADDLVEKVRFYLAHEAERQRIALNAFRRVMREHRIRDRLRQAARLIEAGMRGRSAPAATMVVPLGVHRTDEAAPATGAAQLPRMVRGQ